MIKNKLGLFFLLLFVCSCAKTFDSQEELAAYIDDEDNGYKYSKTINGVDYILQYRPTDLMVKQESGGQEIPETIEKLRAKYRKYLYFNLSMSKNNQELLSGVAGDKSKFGTMVNDLAFEMNEKIHLYTTDKDTLEMADFIYPRMYGMTNSTAIMIVYPREEKWMKEEYLNLTVEDLGLDTGDIRFKLNTGALQEEPQLRF